jgi:hypothetical protein
VAATLLVVVASTFLPLRAASAQQTEVPFGSEGRYRLGPLRFTPSLVVGDIGVDSNVFNEPVDPKRDVTAVVGPGVKVWLPAGRARIFSSNAGQYVYFKTYESQRGWNGMNALRTDFRLGRLTPFATGTYNNTRNRPGYEIDARSRATVSAVSLGTDLRLSPKLSIVASGERELTTFDSDETFRGAALARQLNRQSNSEHVALRHTLTPLTTFVVKADVIRDRFESNDLRDSNSLRVMPGFEFKPFALVSGTVFVGMRDFNPTSGAVPSYRGPVAAVNANYVLRALRFSGSVNRDITYSFEPAEPYYVLTDVGLGATWRLRPTWDVRVRGSRQALNYKSLGLLGSTVGRTDHAHQFGAGLGYVLGTTARIGLDALYSTRDAVTQFRSYQGLRIGASVSYGLQ